ncbi:hypothetical protein J6590_047140 [Homalodisca vitripennis]|nr:hypothetical protein J6590_047140 [Homalodisca vitripennis]
MVPKPSDHLNTTLVNFFDVSWTVQTRQAVDKQSSTISVEEYFVSIKQELSYRKPLPILRQRSKSSGLVDNVIAESRRPFSWCFALLYFRVLPVHFSKYKNSTKTNITKLKLNSLLKKHSKLVFILDHTPPPKMRVPPAISTGFGSTSFGAAPC